MKGYPGTVYARGERAGQPKLTAPTTQARHRFAQALLTAVLVGGSEERAEVAIALLLVGEGGEVEELLGS